MSARFSPGRLRDALLLAAASSGLTLAVVLGAGMALYGNLLQAGLKGKAWWWLAGCLALAAAAAAAYALLPPPGPAPSPSPLASPERRGV